MIDREAKVSTPCGKDLGFTLVELMITLVLASLITAAMYSAYRSQQRTYTAQEQVAALQQNIRAALDLLSYDLRLAGIDPKRTGLFGITIAETGRLAIAMDITGGEADGVDNNGDGAIDEIGEDYNGLLEANETITYSLDANDPDFDGVPTVKPVADLGRNSGGGLQTIAENVNRIEFRYLDSTGAVLSLPITDAKRIRSIQVTLLFRAAQSDPDYTDAQTYTTPGGIAWGPFGDNFRRRFMTIIVNCRNMGM